jgi:hypothetical protein
MEPKEQGTIKVIFEGKIRKGGSNTAPTTSHPSLSIQGFGPIHGSAGCSSPSTKGVGGSQSSK